MVDYATRSGTLSHTSSETEVRGKVSKGKGRVSTNHKMRFRVDGRPAYINTSADLSDGDVVTAIGKDKKGELEVYAVRNETTGIVYSIYSPLWYAASGFMVVVGIALLVIVIGIFFIGLGGWMIYQTWTVQNSITVLKGMPPASPSPLPAA